MSYNGDATPLLTTSGFTTNAGVRLQINTRNVDSGGMTAGMVRVRVNGDLGIDGFDFDSAFAFTASNGLFSSSVSISVDIFGFKEVNVTGTIRSDGYVNIDGSASISVGDSNLGASLTLSVHFTASAGGVGDFSASASGSGHFFGASASASGTLSEGGNLTLTFRAAGVNLGTATFDLENDGNALSGPLAGATVFFDVNNNLVLDPGEPSAISNADGKYRLNIPVGTFDRNGNGVIDAGDGYIVAFGGIDRFTGLPNTAILRGVPTLWRAGVPVMLTPVTTLGSMLVANGATIAQAEDALRRALGLTAFTYTLFNTNPFDQADTPASRELYRAGVEIQSSTFAAAGLLTGANSALTPASATAAFQSALANALLKTPGTTLDNVLKNTGALSAVLAEAAGATKSTLTTQMIDGAAQVITDIVTRIDALAVGGTTFYADITRFKSVAATNVASDLSAAAAGTISIATAVAQNTGTSLTGLVSAVTLPPDFQVPTPPPPPPPEQPEDIVTTLPDGTIQHIRVTTVSENLTGTPKDTLFKVTINPAVPGTQTVKTLVINLTGGEGAPTAFQLHSSVDNYRATLDVVKVTGDDQEITIELDKGVSATGPISFVLVAIGQKSDARVFAVSRVEVTAVTAPAAKPASVAAPSRAADAYRAFMENWDEDDAMAHASGRELVGLVPPTEHELRVTNGRRKE